LSLSDSILRVIEENPRLKHNSTSVLYLLIGDEKIRTLTPIQRKKFTAKIRTVLARLKDRKKIRKVSRGRYQALPLPRIINKLENPEVKMHGIKIECHIAENNINGVLPSTSQNNIIEDWLDKGGFESFGYNKWKSNHWWDDRKITFIVHAGGLVEIWVNASDSPFSFTDFVRWLEWLNGFFVPLLFKKSEMFVRQIGFNRDFKLLRIDGAKSVSLKLMQNVWSQAYQKENILRFEHHATFPQLTVDLDSLVKSLLLINEPLSEKNGNGDTGNDGVMFG